MMNPLRRPTEIEPGLLQVFRLFMVVSLMAMALPALFVLPTQLRGVVYSQLLTTIVVKLAILLYIGLPWLRRQLGAVYLPLAIAAATLDLLVMESLLSKIVATAIFDRVVTGDPLQMSQAEGFALVFLLIASQLPPTLLIVLIMVSWQYSFVGVLKFIIFTLAVELFLNLVGRQPSPHELVLDLGVVPVRTLTFLGCGFIISQLMRVQRAQRRELADANHKLSQYAAMVERLTISRERNRLAHELHDTLAHSLSAASVQLEAVNSLWAAAPDRAHDLLGQSLHTVRAGLTETRRALHQLRASPLEDLGLVLALRELGEGAQARGGGTYTLELPDQTPPLTPDVEQAIYRVAQETLENVVRHAQAAHITMRLHALTDGIQLEIADDGVGFDPYTVDNRRHFGIQGMLERIRMLGGQLAIDSQPGRGTRVTLQMRRAS